MAITATATKIHTATYNTQNTGAWGIISQANGSYLCGFSETAIDFPFTAVGTWHKSINGGSTWSIAGTSDGLFGQGQTFPSNVHANIILAPATIPVSNTSLILRSVDAAAHWTTVYSAEPSPTPPGRITTINGVQSYDRSSAVAWGELDGNFANPPMIWATSNHAGANWTPQPSWDVGDGFDQCNALAVAAGGIWYAAYTKFGGINRQSWLAKTADYGTNWTVLQQTGALSTNNYFRANAFCCFDGDNFALAGLKSTSPASSSPGVYYSHDAGATLHLLSAGDIANWPSGSFNTVSYELKRLTVDACILAFGQENGSPGSPWRISIDKGETYPIEVTPVGASWTTYQLPLGKIVVTPAGDILAPLWQTDTYEDSELTIWRINLHC